jgi:hypothetical protein
MGPVFEPEYETAFRELRRGVTEHRSVGRVHVEFRRLSGSDRVSAGSIATAFVESLALRPPKTWTELDARDALHAATRVLHLDLAYSAHVMTSDMAKSLAARFLECCGEGAAFLTNGSLALTGTGAWSSLTDATFDTGIVGVSSRRVGLLWVEDED